MRGALAALALALWAVPATAQKANCATDQTQMALTACAQQDWSVADAELNRLWGVLKPAADAQGWGDRLLGEQRNWLAFRDATCEAERAVYEGGSIAPMVYWDCMTRLTLARNGDFRDMMR